MRTSVTDPTIDRVPRRPLDKRIGWGLSELALALSVSRNFLRDEIVRGKLVAKKLGRRVIVLDSDVRKYLASRPAKSA